jgi:hypothetical protein
MGLGLLGIEVAVDLHPFGTFKSREDVIEEVFDVVDAKKGMLFLQFGDGVFLHPALEFDCDFRSEFHFVLLFHFSDTPSIPLHIRRARENEKIKKDFFEPLTLDVLYGMVYTLSVGGDKL